MVGGPEQKEGSILAASRSALALFSCEKLELKFH